MAYKQYVKDGKVITATEKAFKVVYSEQGYEPYEEPKELEETPEETEENVETDEKIKETIDEDIEEALNELTVSELQEMAKKEEIKGYSSMKKAELIEALK